MWLATAFSVASGSIHEIFKSYFLQPITVHVSVEANLNRDFFYFHLFPSGGTALLLTQPSQSGPCPNQLPTPASKGKCMKHNTNILSGFRQCC